MSMLTFIKSNCPKSFNNVEEFVDSFLMHRNEMCIHCDLYHNCKMKDKVKTRLQEESQNEKTIQMAKEQ